ncbi:MAG: T9SS type A sorting domain-containing protein [Muribaculaceae bacterium]|nr:T9SS type A sorting domain-containing protein [Muribaculaceae bacterium]
MKKQLHFFATVVALLMLSTSFMANASSKRIASFDTNASVKVLGGHKWKKEAKTFQTVKNNKIGTRGVTLGPTQGYAFLEAADGSQWYVTQNNEIENYYYKSSELSFYNSKGELQGSFSVTLPDTVSCNQIMVGELLTNNLFDKNKSSYELPVIAHFIHSPGVTSYVTYIYDIATGELKNTYNGIMSVVRYSTGYSYEAVGILSYTAQENGETVSKYEIYSKPGWNATSAQLKKTFSVPNKLAEYQVGGVLNVFEIDNSLYYVLSQYEKEYLDPASYEEPWDMIPTADNNFVSTIYDMNFKKVGTVTIPVESISKVLVQYGVGLFGYKDLSKNFWDNSDNLSLVVATTNFVINTEEEAIRFDVYDTEGNKVKTIAENVNNWMNMYDIPGESAQMAFLSTDGTTMSMVNIPSCETEVVFEAEIDGTIISTNVDRYPVGDSYQYVMGLPAPEVDSEGNVYQRYAWINRNVTIDRIVKFNLGDTNANWTPLVIGEVMNPYLFDTDSQREYIFIANQRETATSSNMIDEVRIVKEDGTIVRIFKEEPNGKGDLGTCSLFGVHGDTPTLFIPFYNSSNDAITIELEFLPFETKNMEGEGTQANPYLITNASDMAMIARNPSAHYKVANDFDAADFGAWKSISGFTGSFDGDNHVISNLGLDGEKGVVGLFATAESANIKNFVLDSPKVTLTNNSTTVGFVVGSATADTISNVHVKNAVLRGANTQTYVGSIAGEAFFYTEISGCSSTDMMIDAASASVGGIAGKVQTSSNVSACAVTGSIVGGAEVGGIAGYASAGCVFRDCRVDATITADNNVGGIVGNAERGGIFNCMVEGSLVAKKADMKGYARLGGVVGTLASDWSEEGEEIDRIIVGNVVKVDSLVAPNMNGVHRIVGYSRFEDDTEAKKDDPKLVPVKEAGLDKNYAMGINAVDSTVEADGTSTEGADLADADFNQAFLESIGFKFGDNKENPWVFVSDAMPCLYFEKANSSAVESVVADKVKIAFDGQKLTVSGAATVELYSIAGVRVAKSNSDELSVNGVATGVYVVVATDANGAKTAAKIVVK